MQNKVCEDLINQKLFGGSCVVRPAASRHQSYGLVSLKKLFRFSENNLVMSSDTIPLEESSFLMS